MTVGWDIMDSTSAMGHSFSSHLLRRIDRFQRVTFHHHGSIFVRKCRKQSNNKAKQIINFAKKKNNKIIHIWIFDRPQQCCEIASPRVALSKLKHNNESDEGGARKKPMNNNTNLSLLFLLLFRRCLCSVLISHRSS